MTFEAKVTTPTITYTLADCMWTKTSILWLIIKKNKIKAARCHQINSPQHWLNRNCAFGSYRQIRSTLGNNSQTAITKPLVSFTYTQWILPICIRYSSILPPGRCVNKQLQGRWHRYRAGSVAEGSTPLSRKISTLETETLLNELIWEQRSGVTC